MKENTKLRERKAEKVKEDIKEEYCRFKEKTDKEKNKKEHGNDEKRDAWREVLLYLVGLDSTKVELNQT